MNCDEWERRRYRQDESREKTFAEDHSSSASKRRDSVNGLKT